MKRTRLWLLVIHCVYLRLEFAIKDGLKESSFTAVNQIMLDLYLLTGNSGKVKGLMNKITHQLGWWCVWLSLNLRFQNHKYRDVKTLIINYLPTCLLMENYTCVGSKLGALQYVQ